MSTTIPPGIPAFGDRVRYWVTGPLPTTRDGAIGTIVGVEDGIFQRAIIRPDRGQGQQPGMLLDLCQGVAEGYVRLADRPDDPQTVLEARLADDRAIGRLIGYREVQREELTETPETLLVTLYRGANSHVVRGTPYLLTPDATAGTPAARYSQQYTRWEPTQNDAHAIEALTALTVSHQLTYDGAQHTCRIYEHRFGGRSIRGEATTRAGAIGAALLQYAALKEQPL